MQKMRFLDILVVFKLDLGQISFNLAENASATRQLAFLATGIAFYDISTRACAEIRSEVILVPRAYDPSGLRQGSRGSGSNHSRHAPWMQTT